MQDLKNFISEKLDISKDYSGYNYRPTTKQELQDLLEQLVNERGQKDDFNDIDTSLITDMSGLFEEIPYFNGDISRWNTSKVTNMRGMFYYARDFNCDISRWDTSKVTDMNCMFHTANKFNQPISKWNTSKVEDMHCMFYRATSFNQDISNWNTSKVNHAEYIFDYCPIKESYKPKKFQKKM